MKRLMIVPARSAAGFTLIELAVVAVLVAVLAATVLPQFVELEGRAHDSAIEDTAEAFSAGVGLVKSQWVTNGLESGAIDLEGFANGTVDTSSNGWPVDGTSDGVNATSANMTAERCINVWNAVMQGDVPTAGTATGQVDYQVTTESDRAGTGNSDCVFTYLKDGDNSSIRYDADTGDVVTTLRRQARASG